MQARTMMTFMVNEAAMNKKKNKVKGCLSSCSLSNCSVMLTSLPFIHAFHSVRSKASTFRWKMLRFLENVYIFLFSFSSLTFGGGMAGVNVSDMWADWIGSGEDRSLFISFVNKRASIFDRCWLPAKFCFQLLRKCFDSYCVSCTSPQSSLAFSIIIDSCSGRVHALRLSKNMTRKCHKSASERWLRSATEQPVFIPCHSKSKHSRHRMNWNKQAERLDKNQLCVSSCIPVSEKHIFLSWSSILLIEEKTNKHSKHVKFNCV